MNGHACGTNGYDDTLGYDTSHGYGAYACDINANNSNAHDPIAFDDTAGYNLPVNDANAEVENLTEEQFSVYQTPLLPKLSSQLLNLLGTQNGMQNDGTDDCMGVHGNDSACVDGYLSEDTFDVNSEVGYLAHVKVLASEPYFQPRYNPQILSLFGMTTNASDSMNGVCEENVIYSQQHMSERWYESYTEPAVFDPGVLGLAWRMDAGMKREENTKYVAAVYDEINVMHENEMQVANKKETEITDAETEIPLVLVKNENANEKEKKTVNAKKDKLEVEKIDSNAMNAMNAMNGGEVNGEEEKGETFIIKDEDVVTSSKVKVKAILKVQIMSEPTAKEDEIRKKKKNFVSSAIKNIKK